MEDFNSGHVFLRSGCDKLVIKRWLEMGGPESVRRKYPLILSPAEDPGPMGGWSLVTRGARCGAFIS